MTFRSATLDDCTLLARLNHQLIQDEGHRNRMALSELEQRMKRWLSGEYRAVLFEDEAEVVAYALFREQSEDIYLRQFFVVRDRRSRGIGRKAVELLRAQVWPKNKRLTVEVLVANRRAAAFWRSAGYADYCLTLEILPGGSTCAPSAAE
jgi:predicted acetyltransferase